MKQTRRQFHCRCSGLSNITEEVMYWCTHAHRLYSNARFSRQAEPTRSMIHAVMHASPVKPSRAEPTRPMIHVVTHASPVKPSRPDPWYICTWEHRLFESKLTESPEPRHACEICQLGNEFRLLNKHHCCIFHIKCLKMLIYNCIHQFFIFHLF
jgi:hypothetical protein